MPKKKTKPSHVPSMKQRIQAEKERKLHTNASSVLAAFVTDITEFSTIIPMHKIDMKKAIADIRVANEDSANQYADIVTVERYQEMYDLLEEAEKYIPGLLRATVTIEETPLLSDKMEIFISERMNLSQVVLLFTQIDRLQETMQSEIRARINKKMEKAIAETPSLVPMETPEGAFEDAVESVIIDKEDSVK